MATIAAAEAHAARRIHNVLVMSCPSLKARNSKESRPSLYLSPGFRSLADQLSDLHNRISPIMISVKGIFLATFANSSRLGSGLPRSGLGNRALDVHFA